jgi:predicted metalloprotease with PDZ domain
MPRSFLRRAAALAGLALGASGVPCGSPLAAQPSPAVPIAPRPGLGPLRAAATPYAIAYTIAMPDPASHLYEIGLEVRGALPDTLRLELPVWSPGRYARMTSRATCRTSPRSTPATRRSAGRSSTAAHGACSRGGRGAARTRTVRARYRVYANELSGTFSVLDTAHANWNGASLFMYVDGRKADPVTLAITPPAGWVVVNGAQGNPGYEGSAPNSFRFPNYDELVDTPTEVAPAAALTVDTFTVDGRRYRAMVHHNGARPEGTQARFVAQLRAIVARQNQVIAPPPLTTYTFLFNLGYKGGDGMEHLYSTQVIGAQPWSADTTRLLSGISTASHEYFHTWNVKRIRPAALGPFDYTRSQHQPSLWVAEGWTNYYGNLTLHRAGIRGREAAYRALAGTLQYTSTSPGRAERSPRQASFDAPFFDGADPPTETNAANTFVTYYVQGEVRALALDLMIRAETAGRRSLDDVLRTLRARTWDAPRDSYYLTGRGYTERDVEQAASAAIGRDLTPWFDRHVGGTAVPDWDALLGGVGLVLTRGERWAIAEAPNATPAQIALRDAWLK